jgi:hypothetical protein
MQWAWYCILGSNKIQSNKVQASKAVGHCHSLPPSLVVVVIAVVAASLVGSCHCCCGNLNLAVAWCK